MTKGKFLYTTTIKDYKKGNADVEFSVYGLFNTEKVLWSYHVISHIPNGGEVRLTSDLCQYDMPAQYDNIKNYGKLFKTKEEGIQFIQEYKDKWEYGSNDTRQEKRDQKINDVLGGESKYFVQRYCLIGFIIGISSLIVGYFIGYFRQKSKVKKILTQGTGRCGIIECNWLDHKFTVEVEELEEAGQFTTTRDFRFTMWN